MKSQPSTPRSDIKALRMGVLTATLLLSGGALRAQAPAAALEGCRALTAGTARLACYDALLPPRAAPTTTANTAPALPAPASAARVSVPTPPPAAPLAPAAAANAAQLERQFGLEDRRAQEERAQRVQSRIAGRFEGWGPKEKLTLANGQVWQIQDESVAAYSLNSPIVEIERGAFGSFFMRIEGVAQVPKVRRLQ